MYVQIFIPLNEAPCKDYRGKKAEPHFFLLLKIMTAFSSHALLPLEYGNFSWENVRQGYGRRIECSHGY